MVSEPTLHLVAGPFDEIIIEQQRAAKAKLMHLFDSAVSPPRQIVTIPDAVRQQLARPLPSEVKAPVQLQPILKKPVETLPEPTLAAEKPPAEITNDPMPAEMPKKKKLPAKTMAPMPAKAPPPPTPKPTPKPKRKPKPNPEAKPIAKKMQPKSAEATETEHERGLMHYEGNSVAKVFHKAAEWFHKAAAKDYAESQYMLGVMAYQGHGGPQDFAVAAQWFRKAATQEHTGAQYNLGFLYYEGKGIKKDNLQAYMWIDRAANLGHKKSIQARILLKRILPKEIYER